MIICTTSNETQSQSLEFICENGGILQGSPLIILKIGLHGFVETHRLGSDGMHQGATLHFGENSGIYR